MTLKCCRDSVGERASLTLSKTFVREEEKCSLRTVVQLRQCQRSTQGIPELVALKVWFFLAGNVRIKAISVERTVAEGSPQTLPWSLSVPVLLANVTTPPLVRPPLGLICRGENLETLARSLPAPQLQQRCNRTRVVFAPPSRRLSVCGKFASVDAESVGKSLALLIVSRLRAVCGHALSEVHQLQRVTHIERCVFDEMALDHISAVRNVGDQFGLTCDDRYLLALTAGSGE